MKLRLEIDAPDGRSFELDGSPGAIRLGRDPQAQVSFEAANYEMVSWEHAQIEIKPGGAFLSDCGSTNGTFLNDRQISRRVQIKNGDSIRLGQSGPKLRLARATTGLPATPSADQGATLPRVSTRPAAVSLRERRSLVSIIAGIAILLLVAGAWAYGTGLIPFAGGLEARMNEVADIDAQEQHVEADNQRPAQPGPAIPLAPQPQPPQEQIVRIINEENDPLVDLALAGLELQKGSREQARQTLQRVEAQIKAQQQSLDDLLGELNSLKGEAAPLEEQAALRQLALEWAARKLDEPPQESAPAAGSLYTPRMWDQKRRQWRQLREVAGDPSLAMTPDVRGAIRSGRALNVLLQHCGSAALEHDTYQQLVAEQISTWNSEAAAATDEARKNRLLEKIRVAEYKREVLDEFDLLRPIEEADSLLLWFQKGLTGPKLRVSHANGPLPLDWPPFLKTCTKLDAERLAVEQAKAEIVQALEEGHAASADESRRLMVAVANLDLAYQNVKLKYFDSLRGGGTAKAEDFENIIAANHFVEALRHGVPRLLAARRPEDILAEKFSGNTARELLAFMCRNSLRFDEADQASEDAYVRIYYSLVDYYRELQRMEAVFNRDDRELAALRARVAATERLTTEEADRLKALEMEDERWREIAAGTDVHSRVERGALLALPHIPQVIDGIGNAINAISGN